MHKLVSMHMNNNQKVLRATSKASEQGEMNDEDEDEDKKQKTDFFLGFRCKSGPRGRK
jgi:hypothetical protein